jgi:F-type H+-transporting ATPase subunit b
MMLAVSASAQPRPVAAMSNSPYSVRLMSATFVPADQNQASAQSDEDQFKHSPSVQWIAKITHLSADEAYWLCVVLNFAVIAYAIIWASRKNLPGIFRNRTALIQKQMEEARKASEDANRRLADIEARLSHLGAEIAEMTAAGEKQAVAEEARIKTAAEDDARKIVASAQQEIESAAKAARRDLKNYAAELAISAATQQIRVDAATDRALVEDFARQLTGNGSRKDRQ